MQPQYLRETLKILQNEPQRSWTVYPWRLIHDNGINSLKNIGYYTTHNEAYTALKQYAHAQENTP